MRYFVNLLVMLSVVAYGTLFVLYFSTDMVAALKALRMVFIIMISKNIFFIILELVNSINFTSKEGW